MRYHLGQNVIMRRYGTEYLVSVVGINASGSVWLSSGHRSDDQRVKLVGVPETFPHPATVKVALLFAYKVVTALGESRVQSCNRDNFIFSNDVCSTSKYCDHDRLMNDALDHFKVSDEHRSKISSDARWIACQCAYFIGSAEYFTVDGLPEWESGILWEVVSNCSDGTVNVSPITRSCSGGCLNVHPDKLLPVSNDPHG